MVLEGGTTRVFIFYDKDVSWTAKKCQSYIEVAKQLKRIPNTNTEVVGVITYTQANITKNPDYFNFIAGEAARLNANAVFGCDSSVSDGVMRQLPDFS